MKYQTLTLVDILKPANGSDCTNGGLSSKHENATLVVSEEVTNLSGNTISLLGGLREVDPATFNGAVFELVYRKIEGKPYYHAKPYGEKQWCMFGGNSLDYSGNGFHSITGYPIHIHDRIEE